MATPSREGVLSPYPLYSTTFTLHRLSPLYVGKGTVLDNEALAQHARHFRDILAGDVLRGVRVGLSQDDTALSRVGSLSTVSWRIMREEDEWEAGESTQMDLDDSSISPTGARGILVKVRYEKAEYTAILLRGVDEQGGNESAVENTVEDEFEQFPLLLSRMPNSLRDTFAGFLATTFDTRVTHLHLDGRYLTRAFEKYISNLMTTEDGGELENRDSDTLFKKVVKDVQVLVGFDLPSESASLKMMEINIAGEDISKMVAVGKKAHNGNSDIPFMDALTTYAEKHLAMNLRHNRVKLIRIACSAFVLGSEGKVKLTLPGEDDEAQRKASRLLIDDLIEHAQGRGLLHLGSES